MVKNIFLVDLLTFDDIRLLKLLEIIQTTIIFALLSFIFAKILDRYVFINYTKDELKKMKLIVLLTKLMISLIIYVIAYYYILKITKLVPSLGNIINKKFIPHTTLNYSYSFICAYIFLELGSNIDLKLKVLRESYLDDKHGFI